MNGSSIKEMYPSYEIRAAGRVAMIVAAILTVSASASGLQAEEIKGESRIFDLSQLVKDDGVRKSVVRYEKGLRELEKVALRGRAKIQEAMKAFEAEPSRKNESLLIKAEVEAISLQFHAHKEFQLAAREAGKAIEVVIGEMVKGKVVIGKQVESLVQQKADSLSKAAEAEGKLETLRDRLEGLGEEHTVPDPELYPLIIRLDWIRSQELERANDAEIVMRDVEYDLQAIEGLVEDLRSKKGKLKDSAMVSTYAKDRLSWIAGNLDRAVKNRQILDNARSLEQLIPVDKIPLPETKYPLLPRRKSRRMKSPSIEPGSEKKRALDILNRLKSGKTARANIPFKEKAALEESVKSPEVAGKFGNDSSKDGGKGD